MAKSNLYKISGHWDHYKDGMFVMGDEEKDDEVFALRPMTCPFQYTIYNNGLKSYRDLPIRYGETSTLFRNEASGEMHGHNLKEFCTLWHQKRQTLTDIFVSHKDTHFSAQFVMVSLFGFFYCIQISLQIRTFFPRSNWL